MEAAKPGYLFSDQALYRLCIPLVIEQLLNVTVGMADSVMVASAGESAVSAVSLVDTVMVLLINVFAALATGGAVVAGQYLGRQAEREACQATNQLILFLTSFSLALMAAMYLGKNLILHGVFGKIEADVMVQARNYLLIVFASIPFIAVYNGGAALFRAMGNSRITMKISLFMNAVNILGNALLIYGFRLGVVGAAIPTLISRIIAAVIAAALLRNQELTLHLTKPFEFRFMKGMIKRILYIGVPSGLENSMFQLGKIMVLSLVTSFGTTAIAANAVSNTVALFQILPGMAMGLAIIAVVSQCVGAGEYDQVKYYTKKLMIWIYGGMVGVNLLIFLAMPLIIRIYQLTPQTAETARKILIYHGLCACILWPAAFSLPNALRAANDVKFCMVASVLSMWIWRIGFSYVLGKTLNWGVFGVWVAMTIDWVCRLICFIWRWVRGKWKYRSIV